MSGWQATVVSPKFWAPNNLFHNLGSVAFFLLQQSNVSQKTRNIDAAVFEENRQLNK